MCVLAVERVGSRANLAYRPAAPCLRSCSPNRPQWQASCANLMRLRGGEALPATPERALGKREAAMCSGANPKEAPTARPSLQEVVFPRDCDSLPQAIRMCHDELPPSRTAGEVEAELCKSKRARSLAAADKADACDDTSSPGANGRADCLPRRLLILFGRHEVPDQVLSIRRRCAWSIRGIGMRLHTVLAMPACGAAG